MNWSSPNLKLGALVGVVKSGISSVERSIDKAIGIPEDALSQDSAAVALAHEHANHSRPQAAAEVIDSENARPNLPVVTARLSVKHSPRESSPAREDLN